MFVNISSNLPTTLVLCSRGEQENRLFVIFSSGVCPTVWYTCRWVTLSFILRSVAPTIPYAEMYERACFARGGRGKVFHVWSRDLQNRGTFVFVCLEAVGGEIPGAGFEFCAGSG